MIFKINVRIDEKTRDCGTLERKVSMFKCVYTQPCLRLMVSVCAALAAWLCTFCRLWTSHTCLRVSPQIFSDLGRLLSCWKHTAAHQIFTAPSNSRLHGPPSTGLGGGAAGHRLSERGEKHISTQVKHPGKHPRRSAAWWLEVWTKLVDGEIWPTREISCSNRQ